MMAKRLKPGDMLEVNVPNGLAYVLYVGKHPEYGDAVSVHPVVYAERPALTEIFSAENYITFYPARSAVVQGLALVVGSLTAPAMPSVLRRPGVRSGRTVETWIIEGESGESVKRKLTEEERRIPVAAIWNHAFLVERISTGWRPEVEG